MAVMLTLTGTYPGTLQESAVRALMAIMAECARHSQTARSHESKKTEITRDTFVEVSSCHNPDMEGWGGKQKAKSKKRKWHSSKGRGCAATAGNARKRR